MFIVKAYRQHNSVVISIPPLIRRALGICAGDYLKLDLDEMDHECTLAKVEKGDLRNERADSDKSGQYKGGDT